MASNYLSFSGDNNKDIMKFFSPFALNYGNFKGFLNAVLKDSKYNLNDEKVLEEFKKMQLHFVVRQPIEVHKMEVLV